MQLGLYRSDIPSLSSISIKDYERIFKIFQKSIDDKDFYIYNTLNKIEFPEIDSRYIGLYTPPSKMAMTIVSYKIYEDIKSWWIIYLLNKDKFVGAPFYVDGGVQLKYILDPFKSAIYDDITRSTVFSNRHY